MSTQPHKAYSYIDTDSAMQSLLPRLDAADAIAIDTEADSMHHYYEKVCLIQLTVASANYIVDPLAGIDLARFLEILAQKPLILHDAGYDLRMMKASFDFSPEETVFDTMLAAQLLGFEKFALTALIEHFFGVIATKKGQKSDWSRRPLKQSQLDYAVDDTHYLPALADKLNHQLQKLNRYRWHSEFCRAMVRSALLEKPQPNPDNLWRIKGLSKLTPQQLNFVRTIWHWREKQAKNADLPPFKILGNNQLLVLALWAFDNPKTPIEKGPKLPRTFKANRLRTLKKAIQKAKNTPQSQWPQPRTANFTPADPNLKALATELRAECARIAADLNLAPHLIASKATIAIIAKNPPKTIQELLDSAPVMQWQAEIIFPAIEKTIKQ